MRLFFILAFVISIALVLFAVQNSAVVTLSFLTFHFQGSLAFILVLVFAGGFITGVLFSLPSILRKGRSIREHKRKIKDLESAGQKNGTPKLP